MIEPERCFFMISATRLVSTNIADALVWSDTKRTGVARSPLRSGEKLADRVHDQLSDIAARPELVRSFFRHSSVAYISDL